MKNETEQKVLLTPPPQFIAEYERLKPLYNGALKTVCSRFEILHDEFSMLQGHDPIHSIESRLKTVYSAYEKLPRRDFERVPENLSKLTDIAGVRVVCAYIEDVYKIAQVFLAQDGVKLVAEKDYIKKPKPNGYRSLHLIVEVEVSLSKKKASIPVEIQLRTIAMNLWASLEHEVSYKTTDEVRLSYREELKECADEMHEIEKKLQKICNRIRLSQQ